ncbi:hypothetical protein CcCBS67573_g06873, partial [Chytriomyces confervae]
FAQSKGLATADRLTVKQDGAKYVVSGAPFANQDIQASKKIYQKGSTLIPCWDLSVDLGYTWLNAFVSIATGEIVGVSDWSSDFSDASYLAVDPHNQAPFDNQLVTLKNPWNLDASPNGWHVVKGTERKDLYGNNVAAASNPNGSSSQTNAQVLGLSRPSSDSLTFDYQVDNTKDAMNAVNINGAVTNMFVASNIIHDFFYNYGFTENAANFQFDNLGKGGKEGDGVIATCQDRYNTDSSSRNNANFLTPADGTSGRMRMYVFDVTKPTRDGAYDNGIVYHEMGHGLSNRLTGGGSNPNCLSSSQSGGMGEGWSDLWAVVLTLPATATRDTDIDMGRYVLGGNKGIRTYPYSTSLTTNPHKYGELKSTSEVHDVGEIWCTMLYEVLWNMVDVSGWLNPADLTTGKDSGKGNADFASVVIQGMKNQPCSPTFIQARDAIIAADKTMFGGKYNCAIWTGFAKRGLGMNAKGSPYTNNADIPVECGGTPAPSSTVVTTAAPTAQPTSSAVTTGGASTCAHSICTSGGKLSSTCDSCVAQICAADSYCCTTSWDSICVVWKQLTLAAIGKGNTRTLSLEFTPFVNCFLRPVPPTRWAQGLILAKEFQDKEDSDSSSNSDSASNEENSETEHETKTKNPQMMYTEYKRAEKIWQSYQKQAKDDEDTIKYTLSAIYGGLSKSMQAQYAFHDTPASLWEELK